MLSIGKNQHEQDGHRIWSSGIGLFLSVNILNPFGLRAQPRTNSAADSWAGDSGKAKRMTALPLCQQTPPSILHIILNVLCSDRGATSACQLLSTIPFQRGEDATPSTVPGTKRAPAAAKSLQSACFHTSSSKTAFQGERWDDKMHAYLQTQPSQSYNKSRALFFWTPVHHICHTRRSLQQHPHCQHRPKQVS